MSQYLENLKALFPHFLFFAFGFFVLGPILSYLLGIGRDDG